MKRILLSSVWIAACAGPLFAQQAADLVQPETGIQGALIAQDPEVKAALEKKSQGVPVMAEDWMISAANPYAVKAGADILRAGGTAADALVAVQTVLGLVEPQSSGLGGGAFLVWYDGATGEITSFDGRETAPAAATPRMLQTEDGEPLPFFEAVLSARSVGVPGVPALLERIHQHAGALPWQDLLSPAIDLAQDGFVVSPRLAGLIARDQERLAQFTTTAEYFLPEGAPLQAGETLKNVAYAETLKAYAKDGAGVFYALQGGDVGASIVTALEREDPQNDGLTAWDLANYTVKERAAVCAPYRGYEVCGMGPPSSGALAVGQILGLLEPFNLEVLGADNPMAWRLIGDAARLAFADRGRYVADMDFVPVPVKGMLSRSYLDERAKLLRRGVALQDVQAGVPDFDHAALWADDAGREQPSTTHISIVDAFGNAAALTSSIENAFGSRIMAGGFLLNNQLTDFSFRSHRAGVPIANRVAPGKRPRSSMSPTIVLKDGAPVLVIGSPGGSRIIPYVAKAIIAHIDWGLDVQAAVELPHAVNRFGTYDLEASTAAEGLAPSLEAMGYAVSVRNLNSGLHAISIGEDLSGGADPRREGIALGE